MIKNLFILSVIGVFVCLTSCNNDDYIADTPNDKGVQYQVEIASPIDIESLFKNDSIAKVPVKITALSKRGVATKSVVEEVIPTNAVLTHRRGSAMLYFSSFWGAMLSDVYTLKVTVNYKYGQWVNGHTGTWTGYAPTGSIKSDRVQKGVQNKIDENSGSWTFSTSVYYPLSDYLGSVHPSCNQFHPFSYRSMKLYYTFIDGNN